MLIADQRLWLENDPSQLPSTEEMKAEVVAMWDHMVTVSQAPALDKDYLGPVIFEGSAATDLFRYLLLSQLEGTPTLDPSRKQDQARRGMVATQPKVGRRVLPRGWTVVDDPTSREDRPGYSLVDNEGTPTQRLVMVDDGLVRTLYMSRTPRADLDSSNGHARGRLATISHGRAYQVEVRPDRQLSSRRLVKAGLREARKAGLDYVLIIRRLQDPSVRRVHNEAGIPLPLAVIKHYADGREELYRGASFVNIQGWLLRDILAAGPMIDQSFLAAWVPDSLQVGDYTGLETTIRAPAVLVGEVEISPFPGDPDNLYLLPPPMVEATPAP